MADHILPTLLPAAVQAFVPARRSESRFRLSQSTGRLAYAQRCQCRNVAERMRRIITFSSFYRVICKAPLMRIYVQAHTYVHAGPHIYTRRPIRTFTQACAYIRVDTCILSTFPAYSPSLNTPFAGRHLKMINISSHRHLDGTRQGLEDSFYLMMFIISFCLDIEIHTCCITQ